MYVIENVRSREKKTTTKYNFQLKHFCVFKIPGYSPNYGKQEHQLFRQILAFFFSFIRQKLSLFYIGVVPFSWLSIFFFSSLSHIVLREFFLLFVSAIVFFFPYDTLSYTIHISSKTSHRNAYHAHHFVPERKRRRKKNIPIEVVQILCTHKSQQQSNKHNIRIHFVSHSFQHHKKNKSSRLLFTFKFNVGFHYFYILCIIINDTYQWGDKEY